MWKNNAKQNAGVAVVIVGLQKKSKRQKHLFVTAKNDEVKSLKALVINPYLSVGTEVMVKKRTKPLSNISKVCNGSMPNDDGSFLLNKDQYESLDTTLRGFYKRVIGAKEFFHNIERYTLWLDDGNLEEATKYSEINDIISQVCDYRKRSS